MSIELKIIAEGTTTNQTEGTIHLRGSVKNNGDKSVAVWPAQLNIRLEDHEGRPVPIRVEEVEKTEDRTLPPDERWEFALTLRASHIKLGLPYRLTAWWQGLGEPDTSAFRFRQVDPGP
ncbi:MAG: hypothetical protein IRY99_26765 [Isosphaeraceae bacterium]|nr:hypothetical protein [Isosphaeraceae bacterium]